MSGGKHTPNEVIHFACGITAIILERRNGTVMFTFINTARYPEVRDYRWCAHRGRKAVYAASCGGSLKMHQLLTGFQFDEVDHIDGNGLNNIDRNLRDSEGRNNQNKGLYANNKTGVKGWASDGEVKIAVAGKQICLGRTKDPQKARDMYDAACVKYHGPFGRTNQMLERREA